MPLEPQNRSLLCLNNEFHKALLGHFSASSPLIRNKIERQHPVMVKYLKHTMHRFRTSSMNSFEQSYMLDITKHQYTGTVVMNEPDMRLKELAIKSVARFTDDQNKSLQQPKARRITSPTSPWNLIQTSTRTYIFTLNLDELQLSTNKYKPPVNEEQYIQ
ncbi:hypothetical protein NGRA_1093 [Nosema granulosis]|uniref:Uncharacterized protein n=1 Tax=Nosema granulosis TaxID=83296 RepID=A0A9P6KZF2_9MICR|nr:hypothetical protein NGRA_1093 [Nosema granulosis]